MEAILLIILVALVAGLIGFAFLRSRGGSGAAGELRSLLEDMDSRNRELSGRLAQIADDGRKSQAELTKALEDRLDKVSQRMGLSLETAAGKTAKSIGEIEIRLKVIDEAQKNIEALSSDIVGLQDILSDKQARGAFGEVQLENLVIAALPPSAYKFQETLSNGKRADCLILLPNPPGPIVVDAKFPLEGYRALREAKGEAELKKATTAFTAGVLKHVNDISERYIIAGETAESALMFLPSEAIYAELHANFPGTVDKSYKARVWIVSPTTLMATLHTIRAVLKDVRMREQAGLIQKEVGALMADIERL
ncbi:MAG: DNA recombination protein RmuC, partial [Sphingomonadales bacterium]